MPQVEAAGVGRGAGKGAGRPREGLVHQDGETGARDQGQVRGAAGLAAVDPRLQSRRPRQTHRTARGAAKGRDEEVQEVPQVQAGQEDSERRNRDL